MSGNDGRFFQTTKKGEIHELREDLNSFDKQKIKDAVKKVIAAMTVGKDVSMLFADVIKSMGTENLELKKLVYLYIINYARSQPEKAILVVNTFQKDAREHPNPLVRALAIRTMGCIRVDRITEYLCDPLASALADKDPYVRKTAAVCTAKLYDINAELVEERGFVEKLRGLISDPNPMVVANAVAALSEISEVSGKDMFGINSSTLQKLLTALNECTEWGQVFILDALAQYEASSKEAESIAERVTPRLQHANSAVVMSAIKVIMKYLDVINDKSLVKALCRKLAPPLVTLLSAQPEIQYVALRNIFLIVQKRPEILQHEIRVFFCKYNDAPYVKMEKLEIMIKLASDRNIDQVLMEFKEYAQEVDVDFVRRAVGAIGRCAIKLENAAERCINVLLQLIKMKVNYVVQEAVIVIKDIFRRYPNKYERVIVDLCENLDTLDEPEAKASMIWIVGEYAERIEDAAERLEFFIDGFQDESSTVQLQLLTATVKLFLKRPEGTQDLVKKVLDLATENSDNPDLRDRGYVYWRLLSTDPAAAKSVVLAEKPIISDDTYKLERSLLDDLVANISTLASVYHRPAESFVKGSTAPVFRRSRKRDERKDSDSESEESESETGSEESTDGEGSQAEESAETGEASVDEDEDSEKADEDDILGLDIGQTPGGADDFDVLGSTPSESEQPKIILSSQNGNGLQMSIQYARRNGIAYFDFSLINRSSQTIKQTAIRFNKNFVGLTPVAQPRLGAPVPPNGSAKLSVAVQASEKAVEPNPFSTNIQMAFKTELGVAYFQDGIPAELMFDEAGLLDKKEFLNRWKSIGSDQEETTEIHKLEIHNIDKITTRLNSSNIFYIARRNVQSLGLVCYYSALLKNEPLLFELTFGADSSSCKGCVKSNNPQMSRIGLHAIQELLKKR